jgi:predicted CDP-diglyceride synthetase/phosphatidate cytidylyltransferase
MYNGLKVSTGVKGSKLTIGFIGGILVAEVISKLLIYLVL